MAYEDWADVAAQLVEYRRETGVCPDVMLWGGEPLLCPFFQELTELLRRNGFGLGLVTNGTRIDRYADLLRREFKRIYVSIDGNREVHDRIRGKGVFDRAAGNLELIHGGNARITIMTVIAPDNLEILEELPGLLCSLPCDEVLLQDMIAVTPAEAGEYRQWMKDSFDREAWDINSWVGESMGYDAGAILERIQAKEYPKKVSCNSHKAAGFFCRSPFSHIHIAWNGNVLYCTDFYDFSAGNVKEAPLLRIFGNELSERFREEIQKGRCVTCRHCSWKNNEHFFL